MPSAAEIKQRIEAAIPQTTAEVEDYTGTGDHFRATVVSAAFEGRSRIQQHRLVYEIFGSEIGGPIHALSLKTSVPEAPTAASAAAAGSTAGTAPAAEAAATPAASAAKNPTP